MTIIPTREKDCAVQDPDGCTQQKDFVMSGNESESDGPSCPPMHTAMPIPANLRTSQPAPHSGTEANSIQEDAMQS
jgi:hypothetical protein